MLARQSWSGPGLGGGDLAAGRHPVASSARPRAHRSASFQPGSLPAAPDAGRRQAHLSSCSALGGLRCWPVSMPVGGDRRVGGRNEAGTVHVAARPLDAGRSRQRRLPELRAVRPGDEASHRLLATEACFTWNTGAPPGVFHVEHAAPHGPDPPARGDARGRAQGRHLAGMGERRGGAVDRLAGTWFGRRGDDP